MMKKSDYSSRRNFLKSAGLGIAGVTSGAFALGVPRPSLAGLRESRRNAAKPDTEQLLKLGVASYSLRAFDRRETINQIHEMGVRYVNVNRVHIPLDLNQDQLLSARRQFEDAGLVIGGGGVVYLREDNDDYMRERFEYAKAVGMQVMVIGPTPENLPRVEKFVKEYDIKVAIHNHGPGSTFPAPQDAMELIKDMDPRVGICNDLGHTARAGVDIMESIKVSGDRLYDVHLKDLKELKDGGEQCIIGEGAMPVAAIFHKLIQMNYRGVVGLEYEIDRRNPLPGMLRSISYMRGVVDGIAEKLID